jgi:hypothetical protein
MHIEKMSVESIEAKITEVLGVYDGIPEAKHLNIEMLDEISQIKPLYDVNGLALLRAANAINMVCDKAVIVERYVEKYYTEFGFKYELYTSMRHLHDEIRRLKHRL